MALGDSPPSLAFKMSFGGTRRGGNEVVARRRPAHVYTPANSTVEQTAGSHSLAAAAHRER